MRRDAEAAPLGWAVNVPGVLRDVVAGVALGAVFTMRRMPGLLGVSCELARAAAGCGLPAGKVSLRSAGRVSLDAAEVGAGTGDGGALTSAAAVGRCAIQKAISDSRHATAWGVRLTGRGKRPA